MLVTSDGEITPFCCWKAERCKDTVYGTANELDVGNFIPVLK